MKKQENETIKRPLELAVIFKKKLNKKGVMIYSPVDIVLGHFDEEKFEFITRKGQNYKFLTEHEYLYGFALRTTVEQLKEQQQIENLKEFAIRYLNELKDYFFYLAFTDPNDYATLQFIAETKKTHEQLFIPDLDVERLKLQLLKESTQKKESVKTVNKTIPTINFDTKKLITEIKSEVIGQDEAIDDIVTILWQNLRSKDSKSNILLIGSTGVGKTEIIRNITKRLDIPMVVVNATDLTAAAYQGASVSDYIKKLLKVANYDIEKASRGIIFIDEIDKKANSTKDYNAEVFTTNVQDELLKLLEDGEYQVNISNDIQVPQMLSLSTKNITFICSGAFQQMNEKENKNTKTSIGFHNSSITENNNQAEKILPTDLVKYGLKAELVGRLTNIVKLNDLTKDNLITIMKNPNNKTIQEKINILNELGIKFSIEEDVYSLLADRALKNKTGARGIINVVDELFIKAMQEISQSQDAYEELIITKDTVANPKQYTLVRKNKKGTSK